MRRPVRATREALGRLFFQRCFYLFVTLLTLISVAPFIDPYRGGALLRNLINAFVILSAVAALGRSILSFLAVLSLATPALVFRWLAIESGETSFVDLALKFDAAVYAAAIILLLRYVFDREVMTSDRLWGAAAVYLMMGVLWSFLYAIVDRGYAGSFMIRGAAASMDLMDLLYFSFSTLTTTGFGDIVPVTSRARAVSMIEGIVGQLFLAILIARLVGVYRAPGRETKPQEPATSAVEQHVPQSANAPPSCEEAV